jgi:alanine racemase
VGVAAECDSRYPVGVREDGLGKGRPNVFDVDLGAIVHNVGALRRVLPSGTRICAAVKANAYGFGLLPVARALEEIGIDALGLVDPRDALRLRADGIVCPILLYAGCTVDDRLVRLARQHDVYLTISDESALSIAAHVGGPTSTRIFVEVDVGLERLGAPPDEAHSVITKAAREKGVSIEGVYTHMHVPVGTGMTSYLGWQFDRFTQLLDAVHREGHSTGISMAASTPVLMLTASMSLDAVDVGRYLYGIVRPGVEPSLAELGLRPALLSLWSRITHCKRIRRSSYLDMVPFPIRADMRVGVVPMGFADGLSFLNCGAALVRGQRAPIIGSLSLEHVSVDLTDVPDAVAGDEVVFIGSQGSDEITQDEVMAAHCMPSPPASLAASVRATVTRVYRPHERSVSGESPQR